MRGRCTRPLPNLTACRNTRAAIWRCTIGGWIYAVHGVRSLAVAGGYNALRGGQLNRRVELCSL